MRIAIGADHAGFAVDYPPISAGVARSVAGGSADRGIVIGGSGQGEQIAANKIHGIRAALCNDLYTARMSRSHNDANVLSMGGRIVAAGLADEILRVWLETAFDGGRHQRRVKQIAALESRDSSS
jgi:ribose 5-phosphate isomerase B